MEATLSGKITPLLNADANHIKVKVTNLWPNHLIGDQFISPRDRYTFTNIGKFTRESSLLESGLIGPVKILKYGKVRSNLPELYIKYRNHNTPLISLKAQDFRD